MSPAPFVPVAWLVWASQASLAALKYSLMTAFAGWMLALAAPADSILQAIARAVEQPAVWVAALTFFAHCVTKWAEDRASKRKSLVDKLSDRVTFLEDEKVSSRKQSAEMSAKIRTLESKVAVDSLDDYTEPESPWQVKGF